MSSVHDLTEELRAAVRAGHEVLADINTANKQFEKLIERARTIVPALVEQEIDSTVEAQLEGVRERLEETFTSERAGMERAFEREIGKLSELMTKVTDMALGRTRLTRDSGPSRDEVLGALSVLGDFSVSVGQLPTPMPTPGKELPPGLGGPVRKKR